MGVPVWFWAGTSCRSCQEGSWQEKVYPIPQHRFNVAGIFRLILNF